MTWIVGASTIAGYAVGISDVRVTFSDGTERDCVQKLHAMGRFIAAGFAGSVRIGFSLLNALAYMMQDLPEGAAFIPQDVADTFSPVAAQVFANAPEVERALHSHIMLLGAHPTENLGQSPFTKCSIHILRSPTFVPELSNIGQVVSIGYGEAVPAYAEMLSQFTNDPVALMQGEMGGAQMGHITLAIAVHGMVEQNPVPGISAHAHVCVVRRGSVGIGPNDHTGVTQTGETTFFQMPPVARTWNEFLGISSSECVSPEAAVC